MNMAWPMLKNPSKSWSGNMPIEGKFYNAQELMALLDVKKAGVSAIARRQQWEGPEPGLYWAAPVEAYLFHRGIDPQTLPIRSEDFPGGATWGERVAAFEAVSQNQDEN
jgi:hypothetical protein